jgi:hypothetical protein
VVVQSQKTLKGLTMTKPAKVKAGKAKHGQGLFATKSFRKGSLVGYITGKIFDDPDYGSEYCIDLGDDHSLEPSKPYRFVNHSCEPNAKLYLIYEDDTPIKERRVVLEALAGIKSGDEITIDYEWPAESAIECGCGTKNCRGWVVDVNELHLVNEPVTA